MEEECKDVQPGVLSRRESLLTLEELLRATNGTAAGFGKNADEFYFDSVATDSRKVVPGSLFFPLIGTVQDGHAYIPQAVEKGALAVFLTRSVYENDIQRYSDMAEKKRAVTFIIVQNNLKALQDAACAYVKKFPALIKIGITGSSGKTTTKEICAKILSQKYNVVATEGNLNSETGLPLSVFRIRKEHEAGIFEMGMNRTDEIGEIARVLQPNYAVVTNIGSAHVEMLGSRRNIAAEKKKIFSYIGKNGAAFIHEKDEFAPFLAEGVKGKIVYFGEDISEKEGGVKYCADLGLLGTKFSIDGIETVLKLPGKYNYLNALAGIALAKELNVSSQCIADAISKIRAPENRSDIRLILTKKDSQGKNKKITVFKDCYNANPDSMESALNMCSALEVQGRKIFVLGDMRELGSVSAGAHARIGTLAAQSDADTVFFAGTEMKHAFDAANAEGNARVRYIPDLSGENLRGLCSELLEYVCDGDFVFLKASNGMHFEMIFDGIFEKEIKAEC